MTSTFKRNEGPFQDKTVQNRERRPTRSSRVNERSISRDGKRYNANSESFPNCLFRIKRSSGRSGKDRVKESYRIVYDQRESSRALCNKTFYKSRSPKPLARSSRTIVQTYPDQQYIERRKPSSPEYTDSRVLELENTKKKSLGHIHRDRSPRSCHQSASPDDSSLSRSKLHGRRRVFKRMETLACKSRVPDRTHNTITKSRGSGVARNSTIPERLSKKYRQRSSTHRKSTSTSSWSSRGSLFHSHRQTPSTNQSRDCPTNGFSLTQRHSLRFTKDPSQRMGDSRPRCLGTSRTTTPLHDFFSHHNDPPLLSEKRQESGRSRYGVSHSSMLNTSPCKRSTKGSLKNSERVGESQNTPRSFSIGKGDRNSFSEPFMRFHPEKLRPPPPPLMLVVDCNSESSTTGINFVMHPANSRRFFMPDTSVNTSLVRNSRPSAMDSRLPRNYVLHPQLGMVPPFCEMRGSSDLRGIPQCMQVLPPPPPPLPRRSSIPHRLHFYSGNNAIRPLPESMCASLEDGEIETDVTSDTFRAVAASFPESHPKVDPLTSVLNGSRTTASKLSQDKKKISTVQLGKGDKSYAYSEEAWTIDSVTLLPKVLDQLAPGGLLDDTALEFFFRFLHKFVVQENQRNSLFIFNSYFYTKLVEGGSNAASRHAAVKRWTNRLLANRNKTHVPQAHPHDSTERQTTTKQETPCSSVSGSCETCSQRVNQFVWDFDTVIIPLHDSVHHWTLSLVCYPHLAIKPPSDRSDVPESSLTCPVTDKCLSKAVQSTPSGEQSASQVKSPKAEQIATAAVPCGFEGDVDQESDVTEDTVSHRCTHGATIDEDSIAEDPVSNELIQERVKHQRPLGVLRPAIFHLDSLQNTAGPTNNMKNIIVDYFREEFRARCPSLFNEGYHIAESSEWLFNPRIPVPYQKNNYDCGIFLIEYLRHLLTHPERIETLLYTPSETDLGAMQNRRHTRSSMSRWFQQAQVTHRRLCLRKILILMLKYPDWKTSTQLLLYKTRREVPLNIIVDLFNSTNPDDLNSPVES